jgi:hypothetical protein
MELNAFEKAFGKKEIESILSQHKELDSYVPIVTFDESKFEGAKSTLNEGQTLLFDALIRFINTPDAEYFTIEGYAGTGKTYAISKFVSVITSKVAVTAPTNKAVKVLADNGELKGTNVDYSTIHKLLALKLQWQYGKRGDIPKQILVRDIFNDPHVNEYSVIILDEASMLNMEVFNLLHQEKNNSVKVIFMGDPAQIPPVNEIDSIPLLPEKRAKFRMGYYELKEIMRQGKDSQILTVAYAIRDNRFKDTDPLHKLRETGKHVIFYPEGQRKEFNDILLEHFMSNNFKEDANYCKLISWTNKTVDYYNKLIREKLFNTVKLQKIMVGEKLIADTSIITRQFGGVTILFNTSDEFEVVSSEIKTMPYQLPSKSNTDELEFEGGVKGGIYLKYYRTKVKYGLSVDIQKGEHTPEAESNEPFNEPTADTQQADYSHQYIDILHEESEAIYAVLLKRLVSYGKETKKWQPYFEMMERFAKVKYNYAITAHKAQGSTYQIVFLIEDDIDQNRRYIERNRIKYTASTRPKLFLHIISSRNK